MVELQALVLYEERLWSLEGFVGNSCVTWYGRSPGNKEIGMMNVKITVTFLSDLAQR
jgi:hypothetical protein